MAYPAWDSGTSYAVGSIVSFNNLLYLATFYHNPANTDAPNVAVEPHPSNPALFGSQRSWTIYSTLPTGYTASPFYIYTRELIVPLEPNDRYFRFNEVQGIYGNDQGKSLEELTGTATTVINPCPANKCVTTLNRGNGPIYGTDFYYSIQLFNPVLDPTGTYYIDGPDNVPGGNNLLYIWWRTSSPSVFRRPVTIHVIEALDASGNPIVTTKTFTPTDNTYNTGLYGSTMRQWVAPGNQDVLLTSGEVGLPYFYEPVYDVDGND